MEIYLKNKKLKLKKTTLYDLLELSLKKNQFKMDNGHFSDLSGSWINVIQESEKPSQVNTQFIFDEDLNDIVEVSVFESPIKRVVDEDNMNKII